GQRARKAEIPLGKAAAQIGEVVFGIGAVVVVVFENPFAGRVEAPVFQSVKGADRMSRLENVGRLPVGRRTERVVGNVVGFVGVVRRRRQFVGGVRGVPVDMPCQVFPAHGIPTQGDLYTLVGQRPDVREYRIVDAGRNLRVVPVKQVGGLAVIVIDRCGQ